NLVSRDSIADVAAAFSNGVLMGARGNSGVILSQIFRGFSIGLANKESVSSQELADAVSNGVTLAYEAVTNPVEGTILTVVKDSTEIAKEATSLIDVVELMTNTTNETRTSIA